MSVWFWGLVEAALARFTNLRVSLGVWRSECVLGLILGGGSEGAKVASWMNVCALSHIIAAATVSGVSS